MIGSGAAGSVGADAFVANGNSSSTKRTWRDVYILPVSRYRQRYALCV